MVWDTQGLLMEGKRPQPRWRGGERGQEAAPPLLQGPRPTRQALSPAPEEMAPPTRAITHTEHFCGFCFTGVSRTPFRTDLTT